jgi:hypothetical protein
MRVGVDIDVPHRSEGNKEDLAIACPRGILKEDVSG